MKYDLPSSTRLPPPTPTCLKQDVVDPQSPAVDAAVAVQAALKAWEVAKAASNLVA